MLCGFSWVLQKVLKLTSILLPTSVMLSWGLEGLCFFCLLWLQMVESLGFGTLTFSAPLGLHFPCNQTECVTWMFSQPISEMGVLLFAFFFFRLTLFVGVEAFDCRKEISDMCNRAAIIFSFKGLLVLLSLYGYLGIQYGYLILYLVAKKDEER